MTMDQGKPENNANSHTLTLFSWSGNPQQSYNKSNLLINRSTGYNSFSLSFIILSGTL